MTASKKRSSKKRSCGMPEASVPAKKIVYITISSDSESEELSEMEIDAGALVLFGTKTDINQPFPNNVIANIIRFFSDHPSDLYQLALTSREFYRQANPILWQEPKLKGPNFVVTFTNNLALSDKLLSSFIRQIHCQWVWSDQQVAILARHCTLLESLLLPNASTIYNMTIQLLVKNNRCLKRLDLGEVTPVTHSSIFTVGQSCPQLTMLYLKNCSEDLRYNTFATLVLTKLGHLEITFPEEHYKLCPVAYFRRMALDLAALFSLTYLNLENLAGAELTNWLLITKSKTPWQNLIYLQLRHCQGSIHGEGGVSDTALIPFLRAHKQLRVLSIHGSSFTDSVLDLLSAQYELNELMLASNASITFDGIRRMLKRCPTINSVALDACCHILAHHFPELINHHVDQVTDSGSDGDNAHSYDYDIYLNVDVISNIRAAQRFSDVDEEIDELFEEYDI